LVQALVFDPASTSVSIAPQWIWTSPSRPAGGTYYTDTPFSAPGSATLFTSVFAGPSATPYGEQVRLFSRFFSAASEMNWKNDCPTGNKSSPNCLVYPVSAADPTAGAGARSSQVLLVPDVARFTDCQVVPPKGAPPCGSFDFTIANVIFPHSQVKTLLEPGRSFNVTWWLRSPGWHPQLPASSAAYNDRLARFEIRYTYSANGAVLVSEYFGGAAGGCTPPDLGVGCSNRMTGCPVMVRVDDSLSPAAPGTASLYLNGATAPYTPYTVHFAVGGVKGSPWDVNTCATDNRDEMNWDACRANPYGVWEFALTTAGTGKTPADSQKCPSSGPDLIDCIMARAAASLYVDGMTLTAATGTYRSPAFDSLSELTRWKWITWDAHLNVDPNAPPFCGPPPAFRTPVTLSHRASSAATDFIPSASLFLESVRLPAESDVYWTLTWTAGRFFQWEAALESWDANADCPPPSKEPGATCLRYALAHDGSLSPRLRSVSVCYVPDAGRLVSQLIQPPQLWVWTSLEYLADSGGPGGSVTCDVLDASGAVILANVQSGASLRDLDPGRYPGLKVRFTLNRNGTAADPRLFSFRVRYVPLRGCLALDRNVVRLSHGDAAVIRFCTRREGLVDVRVYDAAGQLVKRLFHGELQAGVVCQKYWNGTSDQGRPPSTCDLGDANPQGAPVAPGVYFVTVSTPAGRERTALAVAR
jgi:hypothetical protein